MSDLSRRRRELRRHLGLTQREMARLLRPDAPLAVSLISSWESASGSSVPGEEWVERYALVCGAEPAHAGAGPQLLEIDDLGEDERRSVEELEVELLGLRARAIGADPPAAAGPPEGDRFWCFDDGLPITIIAPGSPSGHRETNPRRRDHVPAPDLPEGDAVLELYGRLDIPRV